MIDRINDRIKTINFELTQMYQQKSDLYHRYAVF